MHFVLCDQGSDFNTDIDSKKMCAKRGFSKPLADQPSSQSLVVMTSERLHHRLLRHNEN